MTRRAIVICEQWLGSNGYACMRALRRAGWAVDVAPEREFIPGLWARLPMRVLQVALRRAAVTEFNHHLQRLARRQRPELLLAFKGPHVQAETLRVLRAQGTRTYCYFPDVSFMVHGRYLPDALREYDWVFTTKTFGVEDMRQQLGVTRSSVLLHGFDPELHRPVTLDDEDRARYACDASFIGTWSPKKEALLTGLRRAMPALRLRVWGEQWDNVAHSSPLHPCIGGHEVVGEEYVRAIIASTINIAILSEQRRGASSGDHITSRTFQIPACGAFMLHERTAELLARFREGEDVACFAGVEELTSQIGRFLASPVERDAIRAKGHATVAARDSWDERIRTIVALHDRGNNNVDASSSAGLLTPR